MLKWVSSSYSITTTYHFVVCGDSYLITGDVPVVRKRWRPEGFPVPEPGPQGLFTSLTLSAEPKRHFPEQQLQTHPCAQEQEPQVQQLLIRVMIPRTAITNPKIHLAALLEPLVSVMLMSLKDSFATTYWLHLLQYIVSDGQDGKPIQNIDLSGILWLCRLPQLSLTTPFYFLSDKNTAGDRSVTFPLEMLWTEWAAEMTGRMDVK